MARYTPQRLIELLTERLDPDNLTRREMRIVAGRLLVLGDMLCEELNLDDEGVEQLREVALTEMQAEAADYEYDDDEEDDEEDEDDEAER
jgi:hypothetical protein